MPGKYYVILKSVEQEKHVEEYQLIGYTCVELPSYDKATSYAQDYASKHPAVEVWIAEQSAVFLVQPGPLTRRKYNSKGELLPA